MDYFEYNRVSLVFFRVTFFLARLCRIIFNFLIHIIIIVDLFGN